MIRFRFMIPLQHSGGAEEARSYCFELNCRRRASLPLCNYAGQNHPAFVNRIELRLFHVVEFLIVVVLILCFLLCACKQRCCLFGELLLESRIAVFAEDEFLCSRRLRACCQG